MPGERTSTSPLSSMRTSMPGKHAADRVGIDLAVGLHRAQAGQLGRAVDLLKVDAERAEKAERVGARAARRRYRPSGRGAARAGRAPGRRPATSPSARTSRKPERTGAFPSAAQLLGPLGDAAEILEQPALQPTCIGRAHLHRGQRVLPEARRRQADRRARARAGRAAPSRGFSGKLQVKPTSRCSAIENSELPIHAIGR